MLAITRASSSVSKNRVLGQFVPRGAATAASSSPRSPQSAQVRERAQTATRSEILGSDKSCYARVDVHDGAAREVESS